MLIWYNTQKSIYKTKRLIYLFFEKNSEYSYIIILEILVLLG